MPTNAAPPRLTGGAGFGYEDKVAAYYLLHMLLGSQPFGPGFGAVISVDFQVKDQGWFLDDLLINLRTEKETHSAAISVKSDRQVTQNGFPADFVHAVWSQWLSVSPPCFNKERDLLCLATGRLADSVHDAWNDMVTQAGTGDAQRIASRFLSAQVSATQRKLFESLECPSDLACSGEREHVERAALVSRIRLLHFDFRDDPSHEEARALSLCRDALDTRDQSEPGDLWGCLATMAKNRRETGGSVVSLQGLIRELSSRFLLRDHPDYRHDWEIVDRLSTEALALVRCETGDRVCLIRAEPAKAVSDELRSHRIVGLVGESGCGKSSLAKQFVLANASHERYVWLTGEVMDQPNLIQTEQALGLQHSLINVLNSVTTARAVLVLDAADRFSDQALVNTAHLLKGLDLTNSVCPWRVLITSQFQRWGNVADEVRRIGLLTEVVTRQIELPPMEEVAPLVGSYPTLNKFLLKRELKTLLRNLKVLDWIADCSVRTSLPDLHAWVGLTDVVDWVWKAWVGRGGDRYVRSNALKHVAELEGQSLAVGVPLQKLSDSDVQILPTIEGSGLLRVKNERAYFTHDLLGDWARLQILIDEQDQIAVALRSRATYLRWHGAIRLCGVRLLEKEGNAGEAWRRVFSALDGSNANDVLVRDLLLESLIVAANSGIRIDPLWQILVSENGTLLSRLLKRFLHFATIPDPIISLIPGASDSADLLGAFMRIPFWPYWGAMISILRRRVEDIPFLCQGSVSEVCGLWLKSTLPAAPSDRAWPWRREAAEVSLQMAREVQARRAEDAFFPERQDEIAYEAVLYGFYEMPNEIAALALELCRRRELAPEIQARVRAAEEMKAKELQKRMETDPNLREELEKRKSVFTFRPGGFGPLREPWPDGPSEQVDSAFQRVCFKGQALVPMIRTRPDVAREVILALGIHEPTPEDPFYGRELDDSLELERIQDLIPPMYFRGPFLLFLRLQPKTAIELITTLVNFATGRWLEAQRRWLRRNESASGTRPPYSVAVSLRDSSVVLFGERHEYMWYRDLDAVNDTLVSPLMALEKWLYEKVEAGEDISQWIEFILGRSESTAFLGVLVAVGKKEPALFNSTLMPLLGPWEVYDWDQQLVFNDGSWRIGRALWFRYDEEILRRVDEWNTLPHRQYHLLHIAIHLLLTSSQAQEFFAQRRGEWIRRLKEEPANEHLELLIARLDPANYHGHDFQWPDHLRDRVEKDLVANQRDMQLLSFPRTCRQILDGELSLKPEGLDAFWATLQSFAQIEIPADPDDIPHRREDVIGGGIAVLTICHPEWLSDNADRGQWCQTQIESIRSSPPPRGPGDIPESSYNVRWECFLAEIAIVSLSRDHDDGSARRLVAESVLSYFYETTQIAMNRAFHVRAQLGDDFRRLQNLALLWSAMRPILRRAEYLKAPIKRWARLCDAFMTRFVLGQLPTERLDWHHLAGFTDRIFAKLDQRHGDEYPWLRRETDTDETRKTASSPDEGKAVVPSLYHSRRYRRPAILDTGVLRSAYGWVSKLNEAVDPSERKAFLGAAKMLLEIEVESLVSDDKATEEFDGILTEYDAWIHSCVVELICQMEPDEHPDQFWKAILELGPAAHHWVENFLQDLHSLGPRAAKTPGQFAGIWKPIIEFVLESPKWSKDNDLTWRADNVYVNLMGLISLSPPQDQSAEYARIIGSLQPLYEKWATVWLRDWQILSWFALFLVRPMARELVCPSLRWILDAVQKYSRYDWEGVASGRLETSLAEVLWTCWKDHRTTLTGNPRYRDAFLQLLNILVGRQCPSALALTDKVTET